MKVHTVLPGPDEYAWTFGGEEARVTIAPGDVVELFTEDCFAGRIQGLDDLPSRRITYPYINPQTGPFHVEGAEPGDTLAVHLIDVRPARNWAVSTTVELLGRSPGPGTRHHSSRRCPSGYGATTSTSSAAASSSLPSTPTTASASRSSLSTERSAWRRRPSRSATSLFPRPSGATWTHLRCAPAPVYLGVNVPGALFSLGDGHCTMGEGEACGVAVEGAMDTVLTVEVLKGTFCEWPRIESDEAVMVAGSYRPLEDAFRIAHVEMVHWVSETTGLSVMDAYQLVSQAARSRIANVCDANYTVLAKVPKTLLPEVEWMGGTHARLRQVAAAYTSRGARA